MSKERKTPVVLGLDMGGTHTDAVLLRGGTLLASVKVPTNHQDLLVSTREALHALFESGAAFPADVSRATFGTTLAVNAVVQDACAPVGLLIGAGPGLDPGWFGLGSHTAAWIIGERKSCLRIGWRSAALWASGGRKGWPRSPASPSFRPATRRMRTRWRRLSAKFSRTARNR